MHDSDYIAPRLAAVSRGDTFQEHDRSELADLLARFLKYEEALKSAERALGYGLRCLPGQTLRPDGDPEEARLHMSDALDHVRSALASHTHPTDISELPSMEEDEGDVGGESFD